MKCELCQKPKISIKESDREKVENVFGLKLSISYTYDCKCPEVFYQAVMRCKETSINIMRSDNVRRILDNLIRQKETTIIELEKLDSISARDIKDENKKDDFVNRRRLLREKCEKLNQGLGTLIY